MLSPLLHTGGGGETKKNTENLNLASELTCYSSVSLVLSEIYQIVAHTVLEASTTLVSKGFALQGWFKICSNSVLRIIILMYLFLLT